MNFYEMIAAYQAEGFSNEDAQELAFLELKGGK